MTVVVEFKFEADNESATLAAENFIAWLSEQGEQEYWDWMQNKEQDFPEKPVTVVAFDYVYEITDQIVTISTELGRMDENV